MYFRRFRIRECEETEEAKTNMENKNFDGPDLVIRIFVRSRSTMLGPFIALFDSTIGRILRCRGNSRQGSLIRFIYIYLNEDIVYCARASFVLQ